MNEEQVVECVKNEVRERLCKQAAGHGWDHIARVYQSSLMIHQHEGGKRPTIELAALLHDVGDAKFHDGRERTAEMSLEILSPHQLPTDMIKEIIHIVENLSFRKRETAEPLSLEGKIVQDADRLDALGTVGIVRTIEYGQFKSQPFYDPENPDGPSGVIHFHEKLFKLTDLLNTPSAKRIAAERVGFMREFLLRYFQEIGEPLPVWLTPPIPD
jgi:uncharacterized protein